MEDLRRLLLLLILLSASVDCILSLNSDGNALLAFKKSIFSDPEQSMKDWDESDATPCRWSGVTCATIRGESEPRVENLILSKKQLVGSISTEVGSLPYLNQLNLHDNQLIGSIPPALFNATNIHDLLLSDNDLSGPIPIEIGKLSSLETFDASGNGFTGQIPSSIMNCGKLTLLDLSSNKISGDIPYGLGAKLGALQKLDLSSNKINGSIPEDMGDLVSLEGTLNLSVNHLSGLIPASLGKLPITVSIDLSFNDLIGQIPQNGTLSNQGPTAFLGNKGLCGLPLKSKCSVQPFPTFKPPSSSSSSMQHPPNLMGIHKKNGFSILEIIAIAVGDAIGIVAIASLFLFCYWRQKQGKKRMNYSYGSWCCGDKDDGVESNSDDQEVVMGGGELIRFGDDELHPSFDLDGLLRASAFVMGKGNAGIVYKAVLEGGLTLAVRRLGEGGPKKMKEFDAEVKIVASVRHPNVVAMRGYYWSLNEKLLIYDYMTNGSLASALRRQGGRDEKGENILSWGNRLSIAKGIARGLAYVHEGTARKHIHGNLKPSNILLNSELQPCIADFGILRLSELLSAHDQQQQQQQQQQLSSFRSTHDSSSLRSASEMTSNDLNNSSNMMSNLEIVSGGESSSSSMWCSRSSSFMYKPPEALPNSKATQKGDVYSFGVVLLELLTGESIAAQLFASSEMDLATSLRKFSEDRQQQEQYDSEMVDAVEIVIRCVSSSPEHRPRMKHVVESLSKIDTSS